MSTPSALWPLSPPMGRAAIDDVAVTTISPGTGHLMDQRTSVSLALTVSSRADLSQCRAEMRAWMRQRVGDRDSDDVVLACGEAIDNGLEHGKPPVTVEFDWVDGDTLTIVVRDDRSLARVGRAATAGPRPADHDGADGQCHGRHDGRHCGPAVPPSVERGWNGATRRARRPGSGGATNPVAAQ